MTRPIRIAIASSGLGHVTRGAEGWAADLAAALTKRGEDVALYKGGGLAEKPFEHVVPCWRREDPATLKLLKRLPRRFSWRLGLGSGYGVEQTTFGLSLICHLRRSRADVLHVKDILVALIVQRAWHMGLLRTRPILSHGTEEPPSFLQRLTYVQHLAPWHMEQVRAGGVWKRTWTAVPNFINTDRFSPGEGVALRNELGIPADGLVVLSVAAITRKHKRIDHLISEFSTLRGICPNLPVWLVIAGGWEQDTDALIAEGTRVLGDRVRFLIRFPRSRMPDLYRTANVFVLTSLFEMFGTALIEAAATELPCLMHQHPIFEWVSGPGGLRIDMQGEGVLAAALAGLLTDSEKCKAFGSAARTYCLANFSEPLVVDQLLNYYRRVVSPCGSPTVAR